MEDSAKESSLRREGGRIPASWLFSLAVLFIVLAAAFLIGELHQYTQKNGRAASVLAHAGEEASEQGTLAYQMLYERDATPGILSEEQENRDEIAEDLGELQIIDGDTPKVAKLRTASRAHEAAMDREIRLVEEGRIEEARAVLEGQIDPAYERLHNAIKEERLGYEALSRQGERIAEVGTAGMALLRSP